MIDFFPKEHISCSSKKRFGVCDVPAAEEKAYIAEREGENWIAVVDNYYQSKVNFVPIDHCIELLRPDGKMDNRCDGCLFYEKTIIFVKPKEEFFRDSIRSIVWRETVKVSYNLFLIGKSALFSHQYALQVVLGSSSALCEPS